MKYLPPAVMAKTRRRLRTARLWAIFMLFAALLPHHALADRNRYFHISTLCVGERMYPQYKVIHGAVLSSESENDLDCVITFQTDSILQKFMLRFEKLALDCNDHLVIFDGAHAIGKSKVDLSCRSTRLDVGTIFTQSNYVTLKYTTDSYGQQKNGFKLVITAYKDMNNPKHEQLPCQQFSCGGPQHYCISQDLTCDGVNHCGDSSDEDERAHCVDDSAGHQIMGIGVSVFLTLLLIAFTFCLLCIAAIVFCVCRRGPQDYTPSQVALQNGRPLMNGPNGMMGPPGLQNTTITPFGTFPGKAPGDELGMGGLQPGSHSTFPLRAPLNPNGKPVNQSASGENWLV